MLYKYVITEHSVKISGNYIHSQKKHFCTTIDTYKYELWQSYENDNTIHTNQPNWNKSCPDTG